jgi:hypothetical protein
LVTTRSHPPPPERSTQTHHAAVTAARHLFSTDGVVLDTISIDDVSIIVRDVSQDVVKGIRQFALTRKNGWPVLVGQFKRATDDKVVEVPVSIPDLENLHSSYENTILKMTNVGIDMLEIPVDDGESTFFDRVADFLALRIAWRTGGKRIDNVAAQVENPHLTIVDSRRSGDVVLFMKGYFVTTQLAFGRSTPASGRLAAGEYSFGIWDEANPRMHPVLWPIPYSQNIPLPLP